MVPLPGSPSDPVRRRHLEALSLRALRRHSTLHPRRRLALHVRRDDILTRLSRLDATLAELTRERLDLLDQLDALREELWPATPYRGRRPPAHEEPALSPAASDARLVRGRPLRALCIAILHRHGPLALRDLHDLIHRYGYELASATPVKALADAMGHEADAGRARRLARGVYGLDPGTSPRRGSPARWPQLPPPPRPAHGPHRLPPPPPPPDPAVADDPEPASTPERDAVPSATPTESSGPVHLAFTHHGVSRNPPSVRCEPSPPSIRTHRPRRAPVEHQEEPPHLVGRTVRELHARRGRLRR